MSSLYGPNEPGDTRLTKVITKKDKSVSFSKFLNITIVQIVLCNESMKVESLVIVDQNATVKPSLILVHTARHAMRVNCYQIKSSRIKIMCFVFYLLVFFFFVILIYLSNIQYFYWASFILSFFGLS